MDKTIGRNKKAYFDYDIVEKQVAGIVLEGWEVKSIKGGLFNLKSNFVVFKGEEVFVVGMKVARWKTQSVHDVINESRDKKLLLTKREIKRLKELLKGTGTTAIILRILLQRGKIKFEIGVGRGKRKYDKRESIKRKEIDRDVRSKGERW